MARQLSAPKSPPSLTPGAEPSKGSCALSAGESISERQNEQPDQNRERPVSRSLRRVRRLRPPRSREDGLSRPLRTAASRTGIGRDRFERRARTASRKKHGPRSRYFSARSARASTGRRGARPHSLFDRRRHFLDERAADRDRLQQRQARSRPQRQSAERGEMAPHARTSRLDLPN